MQGTATTMADHSGSPPIPVFRLMGLPNELIKMICNNKEFKLKDLKALRLTNKLLCEYVTNRFGIDAFFEVTVVMSRPSLQAFVDISQHPRFGSRVHYVDISPMLTSEDGVVACSFQDMQMYMNRAAGERHLSDGDAERMLGTAFKTFAKRKQPIYLAITDNESNLISGATLLSNTDHKNRVPWISNWRAATDITFRAVHDSGCKILGLEIQDGEWRKNQYASSFDTDDIVAQIESVCAQLTVLQVEHHHTDTESTSKTIKRMLRAAKHLDELYLYRLTDRTTAVSEVIKDVGAMSLRVLCITNFKMDLSELIAVLNNQKTTLSKVELSIGCIEEGTCRDLIVWIKNHLVRLVRLELDDLCDHRTWDLCCDITNSCIIEEHEDMQACLADILNAKREIRDVED
ncbi:hypothetical protein KCU93_g5068, partial [Aureobasidium melanogenum]